MNDRNLLILFFYVICVLYVFYRATESVEKKIQIQLDKKLLQKELETKKIESIIGIEFAEITKIDELWEIVVTIENKSQDCSIAIDWDKSSLLNFEGESRRVIQLLPDMKVDLSQPQVFSFLPPQKRLQEKLTTEDVLKLNSAGVLVIVSTLFPTDKIEKAAESGDRFALRLQIQVFRPVADKDKGTHHYNVSCQFAVTRLPWTASIEWKRKPIN